MTVHIGAVTLAALLSASLLACEQPGTKEQNAEGRANQQAQDTQAEAARKIAAAQLEADQKIAAARATFEKAREDYRHSRQSDLDDLDQKIANLEAKSTAAVGKAKTDLHANLVAIHAQRDAFAVDLKSLQVATSTTWDDARARLDSEWEALKASVSKAS